MRFIIALMVLLTSCGRAEYTWPALIKLFPGTPPLLAAEAIQSINSLNNFMGDSITKFTVDADTLTSYSIVVRFTDKEDGKKAGLAMLYDHICYVIVFPAAVKMNLVKTVLWHEIAHCGGVNHVTSRGQIMSESVDQFQTYDQESLNFFKKQFLKELKGKMR